LRATRRSPDGACATGVNARRFNELSAAQATGTALAKMRRDPQHGRRMDEPEQVQPPMDADDIARAIVEYLRAHPDAADTLVGIARWWLRPRIGPVVQSALEQAVEKLVANETLACETLGDGQLFYRRGAAAPRGER
jgi:hypothetical protein